MSDSKELPQPKTHLGILGCIGGLFIHLVIGSLYQWGIVSIYITSFYHHSDESVTLQSTAIAFPIMMFCIGVAMRLGLYLSEITHPLAVSIGGQILCASTILVSSYMQNFWLFIIFYGILFGFFSGLNFMVPIFECNKYLVGKRMYVNGLILIGTGAGPVVFGQFSYNYLNPDKIPPVAGYYFGSQELADIAFKVPILLKWLALLYVSVGLLGSLMLAPVYLHNKRSENMQKEAKKMQKKSQEISNQQNKNPHIEQLNLTNENINEIKKLGIIQFPHLQNPPNQISSQLILANPKKRSATQINKKMINRKLGPISTPNLKNQPQLQVADSIFTAIKSKVFWTMIVLLFISSCGSYILNGNYKTYVKSKIRDDNYLTIIGVIGSVGNGCTRFFWSLYYSKTGFKTVMLTIMLIQIIVFSTIRFSTQIQEVYTIEIFLSNSCIGGYLVATPTALQNIYGEVTGANIYGIYWCNFALSNFLGYFYVSNLSTTIGFHNVIYICLGMTVIVCPFFAFATFQGPWKNPTHQVEFCVSRQLSIAEEKNVLYQQQVRKVPQLPSIHILPKAQTSKE